MNINELDSFSLADAVKFHNRLNPLIWDRDENLLPLVREKLLAIADNFREFLGVGDLDVRDITISGSNAAYNYTPHSDIDLHLVVEFPVDNPVYQELFNAKKYQYNDEHNITIGGVPVELYVQNAAESPVSQGEYSISRGEWIQVPRKKRSQIDDTCVRVKVEDLDARIQLAIESGNAETMGRLWDKIKAMRQSGLAKEGEFGCENIAFKILRNKGRIKDLRTARTAAQDHQLSLVERRKKKQRVRYGYGGYWYPGFGYSGEAGEGSGGDGGGESMREGHQGQPYSSEDGVAPSTQMFLNESPAESLVQKFIEATAAKMGIENLPNIILHNNDDWSESNRSFGMYVPDQHVLHVNMQNRHIMDVLRTVAHELAHCRQHELSQLPPDAGDTGSPIENEAHAVAGIIMRDFADTHPELFDVNAVNESSGYIPTKAEKNDPRFVMALTADVRPGATGLNANRMALKTDSQGRPQLLRADGRVDSVKELAESLRSELAQLDRESRVTGKQPQPSQGSGAYRDLNKTLGPETPPTMPAGTVRVDVSDVYDWYKLGQHISNMKGLGRHDFGAGPPSSIISFGDEETEHKFIKDLAATGLDVTDIDPRDPKQPPGMRRIKTDPTYNVDEADAARTAKSAIDQTEVFGVRGYRARCLEPSCEWHSRSYDRIKQAQDSAKKHAAAHIKPGVTEGSLEEGVNDPHIFKAIAMIGPMGAGKSTIARQLVGGSGLRSLNLDNFNELLIKQGKVAGGNLTPDQLERSWQLTQAQKGNWVDGRLGLLIDGSGRNVEGLVKPLLQLEALGYDTMVILVNVSLETSLQRQQSRAAQQAQQYGTGRNVPADLAKSSYDQIQQNIPKLQQLYGNKLLIINNEGAVDLTQEKTIVDRFLSAPPSKPAAVEWIKSHGASQGQQLDKRLAQQQRQQSSVQRAPTYTQQGVAEGSGQDSFVQRLGRKLQQLGYTQTETGTWSQGPDGRYVNITPLPDGQYGWELRRVNRRGKWYSGVDTAKAVVAIFKEFDIFSKHPVDESLAEDELVESLRQEFELLEDEFIGEIKMSPSNLRAEAARTGALAGMEFEMIVPGVESDDPEMEPDYDSDERCRSIDDAVEFFHDGDFNGRREVERLRDRMQDDFEEWLFEKIDEDWANNPEEYIYQYLVANEDAATIGEIIGEDLSDADGATKQQIAQAAEIVNDNEQQPYYDDARDWHREEYQDGWDESDWLDSQDLDVMSAIESAYEITWPHWRYDNKAAVDIDSVAADFSETVGMPVNTSQRYHGATREAGKYVIEPDGSLRGNSEDDMGLEFVSPPMPIDQMLDQLKKVREWAGRNGCYTNKTTGLHINISVPEFSNDQLDYVKLALLLGDKYVLDQFGRSSNNYTKSALGIVQDRVRAMPKTAQALLDRMRGHMDDLATKAIHSGETDKFTSINTKEGYIEFRSPGGDWLDENFDKVENTLLRFTVALKAAMDPEAYREEYLKKLYKLLEPTAEDQKGSDTVRYFADYVAGKIPAAALRSFVKQAQLQRRIAKEPASGKQYWWRVYKDGRDARNTAMIEVVASSEQEARDKAAAEFGIFSSEYKAYMDAVVLRPYVETETEYEIFQVAGNRVVQTFRAADDYAALAYFDRTINAGDRPYYNVRRVRRAGSMAATQPAAQQPAGGFEFELSQTDIENRLGLPDQTGDANYEVVNRNTQRPVFVFIANTAAEASRKYSDWLAASGLPDDTQDYAFRERARPGSTLDIQRQRADQSAQAAVSLARQQPATGGNFTGVWLILDPDGDVIHSFAGVGNVQSDANRVAMQWLRRNPGSMQAGVTVVPEML